MWPTDCFPLQGAAVLRMLSEFITETVFSKGLHVSTADNLRPRVVKLSRN